jgi:hypothetical protein
MSLRYWLLSAIPLGFIFAEAFRAAEEEFLEGINLTLVKVITPALIAWAVNVVYVLQEKQTKDIFGKVFVSILWGFLILMPFGLPY